MKRRAFLANGGAAIAGLITQPLAAQNFGPAIDLDSLNATLSNVLCQGQPAIRRSVHALLDESDDPAMMQSYRRAVSRMKALPDDDPHSWAYQANMHGTTLDTSSWPVDAPFSTCQHFNDFFLSWHRMYLHYFEKICRTVADDPAFALPYWDYTDMSQRALPEPFRQSDSTLFDDSRSPTVNAGAALPASSTIATGALAAGTLLGSTGFQNTLESTPHGAVHVSIGGNMGNFAGAARDPIFWFHHCNIDRLWESWLLQGGTRANPTDNSAWMNTEFTFVDECRQRVTMSGAEVLFTVSQLDYQYDAPRSCMPLSIAGLTPAIATGGMVLAGAGTRSSPDDALVGIDLQLDTRAPTVIEAKESERIAESVERTRTFERTRDGSSTPPRQLLVFADVTSDEPLNGYYEVYVGVNDGEEVNANDPRYVGNLVLFGADRQSRDSMGMMHHQPKVLDATDALARLATRGDIGNDTVTVHLKPVGPADDGAIPGDGVNARVGTVLVRTE